MYLFTIKYDEVGKATIKNLQKNLRGTARRLIVRGRGPRPNRRYYAALPLSLAPKVAVYLEDKPKTKFVKVVDLSDKSGYRWVSQPTKWFGVR